MIAHGSENVLYCGWGNLAAGPPGATPAGLDRGGNGATVYVAERTAMAGAVAYRETPAAGNHANPPRLSGSVISRGLPNGSEVRGCLSRRKTASCALMDSPWDVTAS